MTFGDFISSVGNDVGNFFKDPVKSVEHGFDSVFHGFTHIIGGGVNSIGQILQQVAGQGGAIIGASTAAVGKGVGESVKSVLGGLGGWALPLLLVGGVVLVIVLKR